MALPDADDLADIFFGGPGGAPSQRGLQGHPCDSCDSCDSQASMRVSGPGQGLRQAAIRCDSSHPGQAEIAEIASCRNAGNTAEIQQPRGESQQSQESQGSPAPGASQACAGCANRLKHGTCREPERAGLIPAGAGFGIAWPPDRFGASCPAWTARPVAGDAGRLAPGDGSGARHAGLWGSEDIERFAARRERLLRWGWPEAEADRLAERLVIRDREADPRVSCTDCRHYRPGRCGSHRQAGLQTPELGRDLAAMLQRCPGFAP